MSYTATTIGFGEIPYAVHPRPAAVGDVLDLPVRDRVGLRDRLAAVAAAGPGLPRGAWRSSAFTRKVGRIREPFLLLVGYGHAGELVARTLDALGRRLVVIDRSQERIDALELESLRADAPALSANARDPGR